MEEIRVKGGAYGMSDRDERFERLINEKPKFHHWEEAPPVEANVLRFIHDQLTPEMNTLETGAGHTTVTFAITNTLHTCITPYEDEQVRIVGYCSELGLDLRRVRFILKSSDEALPSDHKIPNQLDFVFIDGAHRFPFPVIDWHYAGCRLKIGGILGVDDFPMPSVRVLYDFLRGEEEWVVEAEFGNTAFFRKIKEPLITSDWEGQRINQQKNGMFTMPSRLPQKSIKGRLRETIRLWTGRS
jgi:hypothetical protein